MVEVGEWWGGEEGKEGRGTGGCGDRLRVERSGSGESAFLGRKGGREVG